MSEWTEEVSEFELPDFTGDDVAYVGEATIAHEALDAGIKTDPSKLPVLDNSDYEVVINNTIKPMTPMW